MKKQKTQEEIDFKKTVRRARKITKMAEGGTLQNFLRLCKKYPPVISNK